ncbi:MAG: MBOAT family protein [Clostridia bacterium]|nr:MBOAT family protein [Clostridia bacterium]
MLFSSTTFLYLFLPSVVFLYYTVCRKSRFMQNLLLLAASLFFYAWGEPKFVLVMLLSITANWFFGLLVEKFRKNKAVSRIVIFFVVAFNLGILFIFKYLDFTADILNRALGASITLREIALPIGISFFTFQAMSYVLDVYREKGSVQKNILYVGLYISFFPQLIAGPIVRYETVAKEIQSRKETLDDFFDGFARFVVGLAKKVLLANSFAVLADSAFDSTEVISAGFGWLGALAYTFQIFFDFSGYSDMAIGMGRMFGFHFLENFNYPYVSTSVSEFWRRWHISLGTWFRDYLYFPLGGSRVKKGRMVFNLFAVWFLTGLWHGANFTFIVWGLMYFVLITVEKLTGFDKKEKISRLLKWVYTMFFVVVGWVLFRAESLSAAAGYLKSMFFLGSGGVIDPMFKGYLAQNAVLFAVGIIACTPVLKNIKKHIKPSMAFDIFRAVCLIALLVLSAASLVSSSYNPFIYFNF